MFMWVVQGGIETLMELCYADNPNLQQNAAGALSNLCLLPQVREEMVLLGGAETMLMLLQKDSEEIQRCSAGVLMNLALLKENRDQIIKNNGIKILLDAADHTNIQKDMVQEPVSGCLALLAVDHEAQDAIASLNGLEVPLMHCVSAPIIRGTPRNVSSFRAAAW